MLTQWYDPETGPGSLPGVYAREFIKQGHQVKVLTGFPNYPEGRLYPGYRIRPRVREVQDGVQITRVALHPSHSRSAMGRILNYTSFALSASTLGMRALRDVDAIWVYNSPVTVALPMLTQSRFGQIPTFLHIQDVWPDALIESGMFPKGRIGHQAGKAIAGIVRLMERQAAVIGTISPSVRDLILERNPRISPEKIVYAPNPTNEHLFRPVTELRGERGDRSATGGQIEVMYAGAIGDVQGLGTVVQAAALLAHRPDIRFTFVGDGISRSRLQAEAQRQSLTNVHFMGRVPQEDIPSLIARADIQMVSLASSPLLAHNTPSKIPSLLASGVPIVAQLEGDGARLLEDSGAAVVVEPGRPEEFARAVATVADAGSATWDEMGSAGRQYYDANLSVKAASTRIIDGISSAISSPLVSKEQK